MLRCFSYWTILLNWDWQLSQMNPSVSHPFLIWLTLGAVFSGILAGFSGAFDSEENCVSGLDILVESQPGSDTSGFVVCFSVEGVGGCCSVEKPNCSSGTQTFFYLTS